MPRITRSRGKCFPIGNITAPAVDEFRPVAIFCGRQRFPPKAPHPPDFLLDQGDQIMTSPEPTRAPSRLRFVVGAVAVLTVSALVAGIPGTLHAQVVEGVQKGARE